MLFYLLNYVSIFYLSTLYFFIYLNITLNYAYVSYQSICIEIN